jgi:hypothetical protein
MGDQHDDHRVGAREMPRAAGGAAPLPSRLLGPALAATSGAMAVRGVPLQQPPCRRRKLRVARRKRRHDPRNSAKPAPLSSSDGMRLHAAVDEGPTCASSTSSGTQADTSAAKINVPPSSSPRKTGATSASARTGMRHVAERQRDRPLARRTADQRLAAPDRQNRRAVLQRQPQPVGLPTQMGGPVKPRSPEHHGLRVPI